MHAVTVADGARTRRDVQPMRRRSFWGALWNIATTVVLIVVAAVALLTVVLPLAMRTETHTVLTGSMRPSIEPGSLIAVRETPVDDLQLGDVITYQLRPGEPALVTHRVIGFVTDADGIAAVLTRGDANSSDDPPVLPVQIRGEVVYVVPWLGYPNLLITGVTRSSGVIVLGVIVIGWGLATIIRDTLRRRAAKRAAA